MQFNEMVINDDKVPLCIDDNKGYVGKQFNAMVLLVVALQDFAADTQFREFKLFRKCSFKNLYFNISQTVPKGELLSITNCQYLEMFKSPWINVNKIQMKITHAEVEGRRALLCFVCSHSATLFDPSLLRSPAETNL